MLGEGADLLNAAIYAGQGNYLLAGLSMGAAVPIAGYAANVAKGFVKAERAPVKGGTEVVQRAMSRAELDAVKKTGLMRGGRAGEHYASDAMSSDPLRARQRLSLEQTPEVRVDMEVPAGRFSDPTPVRPHFDMPGGGSERKAVGEVPVPVLKVHYYTPR